MLRELLLILLLVASAGCVSESHRDRYVFVENVPDSHSENETIVEAAEMPQNVTEAIQKASKNPVNDSFNRSERVRARVTREEYRDLKSRLLTDPDSRNETSVRYDRDTLKIYFVEPLIKNDYAK